MTFEEARALFPALERIAYLNAGSMGPLATPTFETMQAELRRQLEEGRGGLPFFERMVELRVGVREQLAGLLGVAPENLALTTSTTEACNIVLSGLDLGPQDEIVTSETEHFGLLGALQASGASILSMRSICLSLLCACAAFVFLARKRFTKSIMCAISRC